MKWIFVFLVLIGDLLIIKKNRIGFYIWIFVDGYFSIINIQINNFIEASIFGLYAIMGIYGLYIWKK